MLSILVYILILSVYVVNGEEQHCSKFDFEEKVLEKMVRIEFEMEKLKQEMQKSVETVQKMNTQVETNVDIFSKKQDVINDQIGQLEGFKNKLSEEVKHELQTELASFKDVNVGFTVYNGDSSSGTGSNPLKFQSTLYNSDASFNNSTGVFTCIHPGVYFFSATVMRTTRDGEYSCYFMVNNNNSGIYVSANDHSNPASYPGSSTSIVLRLNKNDTVNLGRCNGSYMVPSGVSFTGFRISP